MKTSANKTRSCQIEYFFRPGKSWTDKQLTDYHIQLTEVAEDCFTQVPSYQCLVGSREELSRVVLTVARNEAGRAVGFCSAVILDIDGYKNVLHLGLTCVKKEARGMGLTHQLTSKLLMNYLIRTSFFKRIWITNVACVLSSLGNVALYFEKIHPSPFRKDRPSRHHLRIAKAVDENFRKPIAINPDAVLDLENFVFRGSVNNTVFKKSAKDSRYYHRKPELTDYYLSRLDFKNGDEIIQIGQIGLLSYPKYYLKMGVLKVVKATTMPIRRVKTALFPNKI